MRKITAKENAVFATYSATLPSFLDLQTTQIIRFGTGLEFDLSVEGSSPTSSVNSVVLPCIFGALLQGPVLLATGAVPSNVPFVDEGALRSYYKQLKNAVVVVDDRMTDNARNLATSHRLNALFIVQIRPENEPENADEILKLLNSANINAVTALAGPQSLVLVQISGKYYFYRGLANRKHLDTFRLAFGSDVTSIIESVGIDALIDPRVERIVHLNDARIILPTSGQLVRPQDLQRLFEDLSTEEIQNMTEDISAAVPQLQLLLNQRDLQELSKALVTALSSKISEATAPLRRSYIKFLAQYSISDPSSMKERMKQKNNMLGELRKKTAEMQAALQPVISSLADMMSSQTTSKRTHDLKRLVRQAQIRGNVEATKTMTFDTLSGYLESYASEMGVMLLSIKTMPYSRLLDNLSDATIDARYVLYSSASLL